LLHSCHYLHHAAIELPFLQNLLLDILQLRRFYFGVALQLPDITVEEADEFLRVFVGVVGAVVEWSMAFFFVVEMLCSVELAPLERLLVLGCSPVSVDRPTYLGRLAGQASAVRRPRFEYFHSSTDRV